MRYNTSATQQKETQIMTIENLRLDYTPYLSFYDLQEVIPNITIDNDVVTDDEIIKIEAFDDEVKVGELFFDAETKHYTYDNKWVTDSRDVGLMEYIGDSLRDKNGRFCKKSGLDVGELEEYLAEIANDANGNFHHPAQEALDTKTQKENKIVLSTPNNPNIPLSEEKSKKGDIVLPEPKNSHIGETQKRGL